MFKATRNYIEALTTALAQDNKIKFKETNRTWHSDINTKTLYYNPNDLRELNVDLVKGLLLHETGHLNYTTQDNPTELEKSNPSLHGVYNSLEDLRIEHRINNFYGDFSRYPLEALNTYGVDQHIQNVHKGTHREARKLDQMTLLLTTLGLNEEGYNHRFYGDTSQLYNGSDEKVQEIFMINQSSLSRITEKCRLAKDLDEVKQVVDNELYPIIKDLIEEANQQPQQQPIMGKHAPQTLKGGKNGKKQNYERAIPEDKELDVLLAPYINTLAHRIVDILKERSSTRYTGAYKKGRLLSKNAYKVIVGDTRLFSRKNNPDKPNYTITLLLDESGSMREGNKHFNTYIGSYLLAKTCEKLGFKVNVFKYAEYVRKIDSIQEHRHMTGGGNDEVLALKEVERNLYPEDDNLLFILTDGLAGDNPQRVLQKLNQKNCTTMAIGIGLREGEEKQLREFYPHSVAVPNAEDLPMSLIGIMKGMIHR